MTTIRHISSITLCCFCVLLLSACSDTNLRSPEPLPQVSIGVVGFTQPTSVLELLAGYLPEVQGKASDEDLLAINDDLRTALDATNRPYTFIATLPPQDLMTDRQKHRGATNALSYWVNVGKQAGVDVLIVPFVLDWQERQGGDMGVRTSAAVMVDLFLIDARDEGNLLQRSSFNEKQTGLSSNFMDIGTFFKRGGKWLTARQLTQEAIQQAMQEFGL